MFQFLIANADAEPNQNGIDYSSPMGRYRIKPFEALKFNSPKPKDPPDVPSKQKSEKDGKNSFVRSGIQWFLWKKSKEQQSKGDEVNKIQ